MICLNLRLFVLAALTLALSESVDHNPPLFTAIAPKLIFPKSTFKISVALSGDHGSGPPEEFIAVISCSNKSYMSKPYQIERGATAEILIPIGDLHSENYNLTIKSSSSGEEKTALIYADKSTSVLFLQTDKPIYKPGEIVRFRVLLLDSNFKSLAATAEQKVDIRITDPQGNAIRVWKDAKIVHGLHSAKLELSPEPNLGDWILEATYFGERSTEKESIQFTVSEYILPKFRVDLKLPNFLTLNAKKIPIEVRATYTYGKGLKGNCTVTLKAYNYYSTSASDSGWKTISKTMPINEKVIVEFDSIHDTLGKGNVYNGYSIDIETIVTDANSGKEQKATGLIRFYEYAHKIEAIHTGATYQRGLPFKMKIKISTQDNIPIQDPSPEAIMLILKIKQTNSAFSTRIEEPIFKTSIPPSGIVDLTFTTPLNESFYVYSVEAVYKGLSRTLDVPSIAWQYETKIKIQLTVDSDNTQARVGDELDLTLAATKEFTSFVYIIFGKWRILASGKVNLPKSTLEHNFKLKVPPRGGPETKIIVYTLYPVNKQKFGFKNDTSASTSALGGKIVTRAEFQELCKLSYYDMYADSVKFSISENSNKNNMNITLSSKSLEPGQNVTIGLKTNLNSLIALRGVDQSVFLLKPGKENDITVSTVQDKVMELDAFRNNRIRSWTGINQYQTVFNDAGVILITNGDFAPPVPEVHPNESEEEISAGGFTGRFEESEEDIQPGGYTPAPDGILEPESQTRQNHDQIRVRKNFPETWLWEEHWNGHNGSLNIEKMVPDTITSWTLTGFSLNSQFGISVSSEPQILTTYRPFFITMDLPYSVVKAETLTFKILVHNYMGSEISASVTLANDDLEFSFVNSTIDAKSLTQNIVVPESQVSPVTFTIIPLKFGAIMLNAKGIGASIDSKMAGDAVSRPLTVKPPGERKIKNQAIFPDLRSRNSSENFNLTVDFPSRRVSGADEVKITIIGDLLGTTISNLDKLLRMPFGCGEQNMIFFVPDIVILDYLNASAMLTPAIESLALRFLEQGYQRELTYRHNDGSFSAFGHGYGSTWLTAFVVKSFIAAKPYIPHVLDESVIDSGLKFLIGKQKQDGSFEESGTVVHSELKGGVLGQDGVTLTAYTALAFLDAQKSGKSNEYSKEISAGLDFVIKTVDKNDTYAVILTAYALQLAKHQKADKFFNLVKSKGIPTEGQSLMHWESSDSTTSTKVKPISIEMTAYALLIYLNRNFVPESVPIAKWLLRQRNELGGFLSTQDTVVGLTALASFAKATRAPITDIEIKADHSKGTQTIHVNNENAIVLQEFYLPSDTKWVNSVVTGKGTALIHLTSSYYLEHESSKRNFVVNVEAKSSRANSNLKLNICAAYKGGGVSNMAVIETNLPSGYLFEKEDLNELNKNSEIKRFEMEEGDTKLITYFDSLGQNKTCFSTIATSAGGYNVKRPAPAYVLVYDYYDTTRKARVLYNVSEAEFN